MNKKALIALIIIAVMAVSLILLFTIPADSIEKTPKQEFRDKLITNYVQDYKTYLEHKNNN